MNVQFRAGAEPASSVAIKSAIADCDIHPARATATELYPYLAKRWHAHLETYGKHPYQGMMAGPRILKPRASTPLRALWRARLIRRRSRMRRDATPIRRKAVRRARRCRS